MPFTTALKDTSSPQFKQLATNVKASLLPALKKTLPSVEAIDVYGFEEGSVIAKYNIILNAKASVNASDLQSAVETAITSGNMTGLNVNTSYIPTVKG